MEEHLKLCPQCRRELNRLKLIDWDLRKIYDETVPVPAQLSYCRESALQVCFEGETAGEDFTLADLLNLQASNFANSFRFIEFMPGFTRRDKSPAPASPRKKSLLRRIAGF